MKRIFFILSLLFCFAALADAQVSCNQGDQDPIPDSEHPQDPLDDTSTSGGISADPNEIIGPTGYDSVRWVSVNDVLNYTIFFENDPEFATANAQKVDVRFNFADKAAMKGFGLGTYGFANLSWNIDDAPAAYQNRLDLRDSMYIFVDLTAGIDVVKQQAFWLFNSIDPETGLNPWQVDRGMLPVNDSTHVGEGFVSFHLKPQEDLKTGDTLSIIASIVFDQNDTIPTNRWTNMIDAGNPTSKVKARQDSKNENLYHMTLQAADDEGGSGLRRVLLYQANNFGIYEEVAVCPIDTIIEFMAEPGHQYKFYSIAEDNVGNREPLKEKADLIINVNAAPTDIALSDTTFQDDLLAGGFIAELSSVDVEEGGTFVYALAEGDSAIHNDLFQINGTQLQAKTSFKCADETVYNIRLSTTDEGGLTFSKAFVLTMKQVLERPEPDTLNISICEGDFYDFHGKNCFEAGTYRYYQGNENMCDSIFVLNLTVLPVPDKPTVTVEGILTLVSSVAKGNQWFSLDGTQVEGATEQKFTPSEDGIYYVAVTNGSCYSEPSEAYMAKLTDSIDLCLDLKEGWNWISSSLSETENRNVLTFLAPIENVTDRFVGKEGELVNDHVNGFSGNLESVIPVESYKIKVTDNTEHTWNGIAVSPEHNPVNLQQGWNWIGYLPVSGKDVNDALSGLEPSENDVIKSLDEFAVYCNGKWTGTLESMKPGEGYMYYASQSGTFNYPVTRIYPYVSATSMGSQTFSMAPWNYNANKYPDNVTIVARLYCDNEQTVEGAFTVGVFCGDECRGIGRYQDGLLYITAHGIIDDAQSISFRAYENATGKEYSIKESLTFDGQHVGSVGNPMTLHLDESTDVKAHLVSDYVIYPRPLRQRMYIQGETSVIKTIQMFSTNGAIAINQEGYTYDGIDVSALTPGTYVVAIITNDGKIFYDKVVKASTR